MSGKKGFRSYPKHLGKPRGTGLVRCAASGFLRRPQDMVEDVRQGMVAKEFADRTPGFGTNHPQDMVQLGVLDDPTPAAPGLPPDADPKSRQDLGLTDADILQSIRTGQPPRRGQ